MNKLRQVQTGEIALGAAVGVAVADKLGEIAADWALIPGVPATFSVLVIAAGILVVKFVGDGLFQRMRWVRRLLLGAQDVEGTWFDVMRDRETGQPTEIGISRIGFEVTGLTIDWVYSGEDYSLHQEVGGYRVNLTRCFSYSATLLELNWPRLEYVYQAKRADRPVVEARGYGYLDFSISSGRKPERYSGIYYTVPDGRALEYTGYRLNPKEDAELIADLCSGATTPQALTVLWELYGLSDDIELVLPRDREDGSPVRAVAAGERTTRASGS